MLTDTRPLMDYALTFLLASIGVLALVGAVALAAVCISAVRGCRHD